MIDCLPTVAQVLVRFYRTGRMRIVRAEIRATVRPITSRFQTHGTCHLPRWRLDRWARGPHGAGAIPVFRRCLFAIVSINYFQLVGLSNRFVVGDGDITGGHDVRAIALLVPGQGFLGVRGLEAVR